MYIKTKQKDVSVILLFYYLVIRPLELRSLVLFFIVFWVAQQQSIKEILEEPF